MDRWLPTLQHPVKGCSQLSGFNLILTKVVIAEMAMKIYCVFMYYNKYKNGSSKWPFTLNGEEFYWM